MRNFLTLYVFITLKKLLFQLFRFCFLPSFLSLPSSHRPFSMTNGKKKKGVLGKKRKKEEEGRKKTITKTPHEKF